MFKKEEKGFFSQLVEADRSATERAHRRDLERRLASGTRTERAVVVNSAVTNVATVVTTVATCVGLVATIHRLLRKTAPIPGEPTDEELVALLAARRAAKG